MRHRSTAAPVARVAAVAAALVVLTSCTGHRDGARDSRVTSAVLASVAARTAGARSGRMAFTITAGGSPVLRATGAFDRDRHASAQSIRLVDPSSSPADAAGLVDAFEVIAVGDTVAIRSALLSVELDAPTAWISVRADDVLGSLLSFDAAVLVDLLYGADDVADAGTENLHGVDTAHVRATVRVRTALDRAPAEHAQALREALDRLGSSGGVLVGGRLDIDVLVDRDGLLRELSVGFPNAAAGPAPAGEADASTTVTLELFDLGSPVPIALPPSEDVTDVSARSAN